MEARRCAPLTSSMMPMLTAMIAGTAQPTATKMEPSTHALM